MDPLSVSANIIAVLSAASATSQALQRLLKIRDVPEQIFQLQNEVSDSRALLAVIQQTVDESVLQSLNERTVCHIQDLLQKALVFLEQISQILDANLVTSDKHQKRLKLSWKSWMKNRTKLDQLTTDLRQVRKELADTLTLLTASEVPRVRMVLQSISLGMDSIRSQVSTLVTNLKTSQPNLSITQGAVEVSTAEPRRKTALDDLLRPTRNKTFPVQTLRLQTAIQEQCRPLCMCTCHMQSNISIPLWMSNLIGRLFIGYSSTPLIGGFNQKCTEIKCRRNEISTLKVDYYFPTWFLHRMIRFRDQVSPLHGHQISVRTPRVCDSSNPLFDVCQAGDIERARMLFSEGIASPFDVDPGGASALTIAVAVPSPRSAEMCRFLLTEYADPEQENFRFVSPLDILWSYLLADPANPILLKLKEVFSSFVDPEEGLRKRRFTNIHSSVLNLAALDLEQQLLMSTANIESRCSMGRTPLLWAVSVRNIEAVKTLLKFGANMDTCDSFSQTAFHRVTAKSSGGSPELLKILLSSYLDKHSNETMALNQHGNYSDLRSQVKSSLKALLDAQDCEGSTALLFTALNDFAEQAKLLLNHGAEKEIPFKTSRTQPLLQAVEMNSHFTLNVLLQSHAKLDAVHGITGNGLLHIAAAHGDLRTIHILTNLPVCCIDIEALNNDGLIPLQVFDEQRQLHMKDEDEVSHKECREAFLRLLESVRTQSPNHCCWKNGWEAAAEENRNVDELLIGIDDPQSEDEEQFFDAQC